MNRSELGKMTAACILTLLACAMLGGCAVDQKKEIATYRKVLDGKTPPQFVYHAGEPLTLEAALLLTNRNDEQLASSGEDYLQALIDKERQFSAFLPQISISSAGFEYYRNGFGGNGVGASGTAIRQGTSSVPVVASENVFDGFQSVSNYRRAGYTAQQRNALLLDLQQTILLNVATSYYTVLANERSVTVLLNSVQVQNERVRDQEGRQRAGVARPLDVAQFQAQAAATRVQLIQAQNNVRTGRIALAFLTSAPVQDAPLADRLIVPNDLASSNEALKYAVRTRQDVQASEAAIEAARQSVQAAIGQYYPSINIDFEYLIQKAPSLYGWTGAITANVPIFTAGIIDANVRTAWSQLRQAWLNEQRTHRLVAEQVRTAYENLEGSKRRIVELHIEVAAAHDALQQAQFSYQAGLATNLDVLTATDQLLAAQLSLATEELNFKIYYLQLLRSEGRLPRPDSPFGLTSAPTSQPSDRDVTTPAPAATAPMPVRPAAAPGSR